MNDHMRIWSKVRGTDPWAVRKRPGPGNLSTIDAYYQFERATDLFGPCGEGWGWESTMIPGAKLCIMEVKFWWVDRAKPASLPFKFTTYGACPWEQARKEGPPQLDPDAPKKALTEALSKALSMLGFSADIYQGKLDNPQRSAPAASGSMAPPRGQFSPPPSQQPPQQFQPPTGGHPWLDEKLGWGKQHPEETWRWFTESSPGGGGHKYLVNVVLSGKYGNPPQHVVERAREVVKMIEARVEQPDPDHGRDERGSDPGEWDAPLDYTPDLSDPTPF